MNLPEIILIVEDEPVLRENLRTFLEELGLGVIEAGQGDTVLEICLRDHPDLVLLDINLPGQNGFEVCRNIKAHPGSREIPVIFLSGLAETSEKLEAFALGGVDYVSKPFHFKELEARIQTHLQIRRQRRQLEASHAHLQDALAEAQQVNHQLIEVNERLRRSEELKSHFIANMRNEINNPLGSILGLAEEICDLSLPMEQGRILAGLIKLEASRLEFKLRNIFCAGELEAGEASPAISKVDLDSLLRSAVEDFAGALRDKAQTLLVHVAEGSSPFDTDAGKLRIILGNLLANAIEFSPQGGRIGLRARQEDGALVIEVEDQGVGLSEADLSVIFERFRQLEAGHARTHGGQGLGLAVVKALTELLDGQILVESEPGRGSKFICRLPSCPRTGDPGTLSFDGNFCIFDEPREL
jgi:signal transduction histidine kinase